MRVIGTAGHVDHGKSTLIAALTGVHPDRLKEEQEREMTIDLGFGWLTLPDGEQVGIVDVPGHRDFIENMLAGVGGIDAALLVIAADEGVMPQTREHLAILDLLQIPTGIIVLTKIDLIQDTDWLDLVESDVRDAVSGTVLESAPCVRVSSKTRAGLDQLLTTLTETLKTRPPRLDLGRPRLPIDRVFSMAGFGTVVTGTLSDGQLALGDEVVVLPSGHKGRIRGLQTHKQKEQIAQPGSRTAVNITGVAVEQINRGQVLAHPGQYQPTRRLDVRFRMLAGANAPLQHASEVKLFIGTSEVITSVRLLGMQLLEPGQTGWLQLELRDPLVAVRGDRFILRRPSPPETIGGGLVVDHQPRGRHKRFDEAILKKLEALSVGSPEDVLFEAALALNVAPLKEVTSRSRLEVGTAESALGALIDSGRLLVLEEGKPGPNSDLLVVPLPYWNSLHDKVLQIVEAYHKNFSLRRGIPREELKSRLKLSPRVFNAMVAKLATAGELVETGNALARPAHEIHLDDGQQAKASALLRRFAQSPFSPPTIKECQAEIGEELLNALIELGELTMVSPEVVFRTADYDQMLARVRTFIEAKGQISVADARDLFDSSRKYTLALLEHLDARGITVRAGDFRKLRR